MSTVHRTACPLQLTSVLHALTDMQPGLLQRSLQAGDCQLAHMQWHVHVCTQLLISSMNLTCC